jgi:hypothetical protein
MQIDWDRTINDILGNRLACLRCGSVTHDIVVGYSRSPEANDWSPRVHDCAHKDECDARRMVVVCEPCARELRLRARRVDEEGLMVMMLEECRRELEDCLDYLSDEWMEHLDIGPEEMDQRLEDVAPDIFEDETTMRVRLEDEYLSLHRWFREHKKRIPDPGWRAEYVEEIVELGYTTKLGD